MKVLLTISIVATIGGCLKTTDFAYIKFGSGGGFTGNKVEYEINPSGKVYKTESLIRRKEVISILDNIENICKNDTSFKQPGNIYFFIDIDIEGCQKIFVWGEEGFSTPVRIQSTYQNLTESANNLKSRFHENE